ncbi:hypothetical protein C8R45DRAFT_924074 [Mycena sanguinolenta]|nr:hypothetical protein C8R45DRAFT_924074 [Mycena sanguinolenta]
MHEAFNGGVRVNCALEQALILSKLMASVECPISCAAKLVIVFSIYFASDPTVTGTLTVQRRIGREARKEDIVSSSEGAVMGSGRNIFDLQPERWWEYYGGI